MLGNLVTKSLMHGNIIVAGGRVTGLKNLTTPLLDISLPFFAFWGLEQYGGNDFQFFTPGFLPMSPPFAVLRVDRRLRSSLDLYLCLAKLALT